MIDDRNCFSFSPGFADMSFSFFSIKPQAKKICLSFIFRNQKRPLSSFKHGTCLFLTSLSTTFYPSSMHQLETWKIVLHLNHEKDWFHVDKYLRWLDKKGFIDATRQLLPIALMHPLFQSFMMKMTPMKPKYGPKFTTYTDGTFWIYIFWSQ